jgi:hypothetical protein
MVRFSIDVGRYVVTKNSVRIFNVALPPVLAPVGKELIREKLARAKTPAATETQPGA